MPSRTHALHNFLPGVTAFGVADMCVLQAGFVRNLLLIEVVAKPGDARLEPQDIQGLVANRSAALRTNRLAQNPPQFRHAAAFHDELAARHSARWPAHHPPCQSADAGLRLAELAQPSAFLPPHL